MGQVTFSYTFPSNMEGWSNSSGFTWYATDGDPGTGCLRATKLAGILTPSYTNAATGNFANATTWESFGVPAGQIVTHVAASLKLKLVSQSGSIDYIQALLEITKHNTFPPVSQQLIYDGDISDETLGSWVTKTGTNPILAALQDSSTRVDLSFGVVSYGGGGHAYEVRVDSIELTITYAGETSTPITITPPTATIQVNATQGFTTNLAADFTVTEAGGGSVSPGSGTSTTYTAPATPGVYHVVATDQDDPGNIATAIVTVVNAPQTITPNSATINVGQNQAFTTNNAADITVVENNGGAGGTSGPAGSVDPTSGTSTTYTAPQTPGTYHVRVTDQSNSGNYATGTVQVIPLAPSPTVIAMPALDQDFYIFLFDSEGERKSLPRRFVKAISWNDVRYGGFEQFSMELAATFTEATGITHGDRVEFWWNNERRYRGYVFAIRREEDDPQTVQVTGYGLAHRALKFVSSQAWVYPAQVDLARVFSDLVAANVTTILPTLRVRAETVGANVQQVESAYKMVGEVINDLCQNQGENKALWGGDVDDDGYDRLFLKPFSQTLDYTIQVPGLHTEKAGSEQQTAEIVNRLTILGGVPRFPNLVPNSSFEEFRFSAAGDGNLVGDPDFENGTDWSGTGGTVTPSGAETSAYSGLKAYETDAAGEYGEQTQNPPDAPIVPGWDYVIAVRARVEAADSDAVGLVTLTWKTSGGATISTATIDLPAAGSIQTPQLAQYWQTFQTVSRAPANAAGFTLRLECDSGGGTDEGIWWDVVEVYPVSAVYQNRWELQLAGTSALNALNWAYQGGMDGGYAVYLDVAAQDSAENEVRLQPLGKERFAVQGGATYYASVHLKSPPGVTVNGKMILEVTEYDANNAQNTTTEITIPAGAGFQAWTKKYESVTLESDTTQVMVRLLFRGNGQIAIDGFCFRASAAGTDYIRDGRFIAVIAVDDANLSGVSAAALTSIEDYGYRDAVETVESVTTIEDARSYAAIYFNAHAVLFPEPNVELVDPTAFYRPGDLVRLVGEDGSVLMGSETGLPIVKIGWKYDGLLRAALELKKELPDMAQLLMKQRRGGAGGGSSGAGSTGGSGSGAALPASTLVLQELDGSPNVAGVTRVKVTEGSLVDNGDGSVTLQTPYAEVIEARDSQLFGVFSSLDARLEAIEAALVNELPTLGPSLNFYFDTNSMYLPLI